MNYMNKRAKAHLYSIIPDDLNEMYDIVEMTDDSIVNVFRIFLHEYGIEAVKQKGTGPAFSHWMQGLPAALDVEFRTYEIEEIVKHWFEKEGVDYSESNIESVDKYYFDMLTTVFMKELQDILKKDKKGRWHRDTEAFIGKS